MKRRVRNALGMVLFHNLADMIRTFRLGEFNYFNFLECHLLSLFNLFQTLQPPALSHLLSLDPILALLHSQHSKQQADSQDQLSCEVEKIHILCSRYSCNDWCHTRME